MEVLWSQNSEVRHSHLRAKRRDNVPNHWDIKIPPWRHKTSADSSHWTKCMSIDKNDYEVRVRYELKKYDAGAALLPTELWSHRAESRSICWAHACFPVKEIMNERNDYEVRVRNELKKWSSHFLDNLSDCLLNTLEKLKNTATASQRSWVRIPLELFKFFKCT